MSSSVRKQEVKWRKECHLEVGELSEGFGADVAFILDLSVLLLQRVRQRFVSRSVPRRGAALPNSQAKVHGLLAGRGRLLRGGGVAVKLGRGRHLRGGRSTSWWGNIWG